MRRGASGSPRRGPSRVGRSRPRPAPPVPETLSVVRAERPEVWTTGRLQAALRQMAARFRTERARLQTMYGRLAPPPDLLDRQEGLMPYDVRTELLGGLEGLVDEAVPDLIETLDQLAAATDEELEQRFEHSRSQHPAEVPKHESAPASSLRTVPRQETL
jgi:hypothetical protein